MSSSIDPIRDRTLYILALDVSVTKQHVRHDIVSVLVCMRSSHRRADAPSSDDFLVHFGVHCSDAALHCIGLMPFFVDLPALAVCHAVHRQRSGSDRECAHSKQGCVPHLDVGRAVLGLWRISCVWFACLATVSLIVCCTALCTCCAAAVADVDSSSFFPCVC